MPDRALPSRRFRDGRSFADDFLAHLTAGVIPRNQFIAWGSIGTKSGGLLPELAVFVRVQDRVKRGEQAAAALHDELRGATSADAVALAFQLLAHTDTTFATLVDDVDVAVVSRDVAAQKAGAVDALVEMLIELGFEHILRAPHLESYLLGVQVGLETHRRKNVGGNAFVEALAPLLEDVVESLQSKTGRDVKLVEEHRIAYGAPEEGLNKAVDFAIFVDGRPRFGIEANFYTGPGSKPTEIKRSYGNIRPGLEAQGVDLIWVTDGKGYRKMRRSLEHAWVIHPNIYNLHALRTHLIADLASVLEPGT